MHTLLIFYIFQGSCGSYETYPWLRTYPQLSEEKQWLTGKKTQLRGNLPDAALAKSSCGDNHENKLMSTKFAEVIFLIRMSPTSHA